MFCLIGTPIADLMMNSDSQFIYEKFNALLPAPSLTRNLNFFEKILSSRGFSAICFRSFSQVIFINNPVSGFFIFLAFWINSPSTVFFVLAAMLSANLTAYFLGLSPNLRDQGIYGFNGTLVGCAAAALINVDSSFNRFGVIALVLLAAGLSTVLVELWRKRFSHRNDPPALTLPFCLVVWLFFTPAINTSPELMEIMTGRGFSLDIAQSIFVGIFKSFGQVFLNGELLSGCLIFLAVLIASPIAAGLGAWGSLLGMMTALSQGVELVSISDGLWGYNSLLVAIAIGGIFHTPTIRSLILASIGAIVAVYLQLMQELLIGSLPTLTLSFVLTTWLVMRLAGKALPALIPIPLHSIVTPEEHLRRFKVAFRVFKDFRFNMRCRIAGDHHLLKRYPLDQPCLDQARDLFSFIDVNHDDVLSVSEFSRALTKSQSSAKFSGRRLSPHLVAQLDATMASMDLDRNGFVDFEEFCLLIQKLQYLRRDEERLLAYLMPIDRNDDRSFDVNELSMLLHSLGLEPLSSDEVAYIFESQSAIEWSQFVDRLLLT